MLAENDKGCSKATLAMNRIARSKARMARSAKLIENTGQRIDRSAAAMHWRSPRKQRGAARAAKEPA